VRAVLAVLVVMLSIDALVLLLFPGRAKRLIEDMSPSDLRLVGFVEAAIAAAAIYFIMAS
jgi:uncharacterized protein YjeT (DUF2065 family)